MNKGDIIKGYHKGFYVVEDVVNDSYGQSVKYRQILTENLKPRRSKTTESSSLSASNHSVSPILRCIDITPVMSSSNVNVLKSLDTFVIS